MNLIRSKRLVCLCLCVPYSCVLQRACGPVNERVSECGTEMTTHGCAQFRALAACKELPPQHRTPQIHSTFLLGLALSLSSTSFVSFYSTHLPLSLTHTVHSINAGWLKCAGRMPITKSKRDLIKMTSVRVNGSGVTFPCFGWLLSDFEWSHCDCA